MEIKKIIDEFLSLDVNAFTEKKNGLTYLSWANAMKEALKIYPDLEYKIIKDENKKAYFGDQESGYMVYTEITIEGKTRECWLPVMDYRNKSILKPTTFDINKTIMRCLTKNLAMFGLGLYIYAGEDLPEEETNKAPKPKGNKNSIINNKILDRKIVTDYLLALDIEKTKATLEYFKVDDIKKLTDENIIFLKNKFKL